MTVGIGRPRAAARKRPGATAREEILDASAELFTTGGFSSTTTRAIADAVGVRQASLYNHFPNKDAILAALLADTVDAPLAFSHHVVDATDDAVLCLHSLAWFDARHLASSTWNLGALYLLPELRSDRFDQFTARRRELRTRYGDLATAAMDQRTPLSGHEDAGLRAMTAALPFRIVESVINTRADEGGPADGHTLMQWAGAVSSACLRVLGLDDTATSHAADDLVDSFGANESAQKHRDQRAR